MLAKATPSALREPVVDINEANAVELSSILPGIGPKLAQRIVSFRAEHGPFLDAKDLEKVPGISSKRFSMLSTRISIAPESSLVRMAPSNSNGPAGTDGALTLTPSSSPDVGSLSSLPQQDEIDEEAFFAMTPRAFREPPPPSLSSLMGQRAGVSVMGGSFRLLDNDPDMSAGSNVSSNPSSDEGRAESTSEAADATSHTVDGHTTDGQSGAGPTRIRDVGTELEQPDDDEPELSRFSESIFEDLATVPLQRSWRVWLAIGALGVFSTVVGTVIGVRSQAGGPRRAIENRIGVVQGQVTDVAASVQGLETRANGMASSIQALDERLTSHERKDAHARSAVPAPTPNRSAPTVGRPQPGSADTQTEHSTESRPRDVQRDVRRALQELESLGARRAD